MFGSSSMKGIANVVLILFVYFNAVDCGLKRRLGDARELREEAAVQVAPPQSVPRRGSLKQRLERTAQQDSCPKDVPLVKSLKKAWAKGEITSRHVQEFALGAQEQGAIGMARISATGSHGVHPGNIARDLLAAFGKPAGAPEISWIEIPTKHSTKTPHPFLLPHLFFASLNVAQQQLFRTTILGPPGASLQYWESMRDSNFVQKHPILKDPATWPNTTPLGLHGDGGAFSKQDSLMVISWNSLLGNGDTRTKRFVTTVIQKKDMVPETMDAIWAILGWSFNSLLDGRMPTLNWAGKTLCEGGELLANGKCGALSQIRGDWQFYCEIFGFPQWNTAISMCFLCGASSVLENLLWTSVGTDAGWRATRKTDESFRAERHAAGRAIPMLLLIIIGLRLECIMIDTLHTVELGLGAHITGNIFVELISRKVFGGNTLEDNTARLSEVLANLYKRDKEKNKLRGKLTIDKVRDQGGWPKLKAKGACVRHIAKYALELWVSYSTGTEYDHWVLGCIQCLCDFYQILDNNSQFLTESSKSSIKRIGYTLAVLYTKLSKFAYDACLHLWKMSPKLHLFLHLCEWQAPEYGNPKYYWCYSDEDLVGLAIEVARSCHPKTMAAMCLIKWLYVEFECVV
jgi:hypothetical protein